MANCGATSIFASLKLVRYLGLETSPDESDVPVVKMTACDPNRLDAEASYHCA